MGTLRESLAIRRRQLNLSQTEAGQACDPPIRQRTISEMETGVADTGLDTVERYSRQALNRRLKLAKL